MPKLAWSTNLLNKILRKTLGGRTDNYWDDVVSYLKTNKPLGYNILINGINRYLNFNSVSGSDGYGLRDNSGNIQFKHSGGDWADLGTGGSSLPNQTGHNGEFLTTNGTDPSWASIPGGGDMLASVYDPNSVAANAFDQDNMVDGTTNKNYTATEKTKLAGIADGAEVNVNADWNAVSGDAQILNKPTIPTSLSALTDDSTHRLVTDAEKTTWGGKQDALGFTPENSVNKKTTLADNSDTYYPSQKAVKTAVDAKQDALPSQTGNNGKFLKTDGSALSWDSIPGGGDMLKATYDPTNKSADAFSQDNMADGTSNKNYTAAEKTKLAGIAAGAEVNVNADWNSVSGDSQILNKPTIPTTLASLTDDSTHRLVTDTEKSTWNGKQDALGFTPENVTNKENTTIDTSTTKYPTVNLLKTGLDAKVTANGAIIGATKTKITYDAKGLVTSGADATTADIADSTNKRYITDAQLTVLGNTSGTNTGDQTLAGLGGVPTSRTVNTKALSADVVLNQDDVLDGTTNKQYSSTEKTKLAGIASGATANAKITGATLDSLTDDVGFVTAKSIQDNHNVPHAAPGTSGNILQSNGTDWVSVAPAAGLTWNEVTGTSQAAAINNGYICNNASLVTVTLPATAAVGSVVEIAGKGAGGWKIAQNASGQINFGSKATTAGVGGYISSTNTFDCVKLLCITANNIWVVLSSQGNITIA